MSAASDLLQARADLAGLLVDEVTARFTAAVRQFALDTATARLDEDLGDIFSAANLGPLDGDSSILQGVRQTAAIADGASASITTASNGAITYNSLNFPDGLTIQEVLDIATDTVIVSSQSGIIEIAGTLEEGDVYSVIVDGNSVTYTVTADDVTANFSIADLRTALIELLAADEDISAIVGATTALVPAAIVAPAVLGGITAATVSAITAAPAQASEINADTVVQEAPANFFDLLGSLVEMGGWLLVLIFVVPMLLGWLLPGPLTTHGKKKKKS